MRLRSHVNHRPTMQPLRAYYWRETKIYYDRFLSESRPYAQGQLNCISPRLTRLQSIMCRALPEFTGIFMTTAGAILQHYRQQLETPQR